MYTSTEVLAWIGIAGGIGFFTGIAVTLSYEDLLDKKRRKTIKKLKARLAEAQDSDTRPDAKHDRHTPVRNPDDR